MLSSFLMISSTYLHSTTMLLTELEFSFCDDDDHMTITHILTTHCLRVDSLSLSPLPSLRINDLWSYPAYVDQQRGTRLVTVMMPLILIILSG